MMLVHWGNTNSKHNHSTTAYWADNWDSIDSSRRGTHPCFDPDKDLVLPAWKRPDANSFSSKLWARYTSDQKHCHCVLSLFCNTVSCPCEQNRPIQTSLVGIMWD